MYLAPEFVMQKADTRSDNWALGVVLYLLISGRFPFRGESIKATMRSIIHGAFTFDDPSFYEASFEVKDLISKLLTRNPNDRYTAYQGYHHPWVQRLVDEEDRHVVISPEVLDRMRDYHLSGGFEKIICYMIALKLEDKDITKFKEIFIKIDKDGDGMVNCVEFNMSRLLLTQCSTNFNSIKS
jgi:calcium-dependent protein kinase